MSGLIYKICAEDLWRRAEAAGRFEGASVDIADRFIHFSSAAQVRETAARHFCGQDRLVLVAVDPEELGDKLKWEPSRGGALFPHFYGALPMSPVRYVQELPLDPAGRHVFPATIP